MNLALLSSACFPFEVSAKFASVCRAFSANSLTGQNLSSVGMTPLEIKVSEVCRTLEMFDKVDKQNVVVWGGLGSELSVVMRYEMIGPVEVRNNWVFA